MKERFGGGLEEREKDLEGQSESSLKVHKRCFKDFPAADRLANLCLEVSGSMVLVCFLAMFSSSERRAREDLGAP